MNPLLIRRRGMMQAQQGGLPYDAEIEYLEGDGNAFINTLVNPRSTTSCEFSFQYNEIQASSSVFGVYNNHIRFHFGTYLSYFHIGIGGDSNFRNIQPCDLNRHTVIMSGSGSYSLDNTSGSLVALFSDTMQPIYLFNRSGAADVVAKARFYYVKIWDGGDLISDFIPVRVGTVGYMYDRVSGQLFGNDGTGDFILGPDIQ